MADVALFVTEQYIKERKLNKKRVLAWLEEQGVECDCDAANMVSGRYAAYVLNELPPELRGYAEVA